MVQKVILEYLRNKYAQANTTIDHSITIDNMRVDEEYRSMRPDIVTWNDNEINIIEISCPYDMLDENQQDKMEFTYNTKFNKYKQLAQHCRNIYNRRVNEYVIIVSSLGAIYSKTRKDIRKLLNLKEGNKTYKTILRKLSMASYIGSYFIYYKINFNENDNHEGLEDQTTDNEENNRIRYNNNEPHPEAEVNQPLNYNN